MSIHVLNFLFFLKMYIILTNDKYNQQLTLCLPLEGMKISLKTFFFYIMTHYLFKKVTIVMIIL